MDDIQEESLLNTTASTNNMLDIENPVDAIFRPIGGSHSVSKQQDGSITMEAPPQPTTVYELLQSRVRSIPDEPLVGYPRSTASPDDYVFYTPRQLDRLANGCVHSLLEQGLDMNYSADNKTVALLAPSSLDYVICIFALLRMRYSILLLSTRLAPEASTNLLHKTNCSHVITDKIDGPAIKTIHADCTKAVFRLPTYDEDQSKACLPDRDLPPDTAGSSRTAFIIHSSGSTGLPKPIAQTNAACLANYANGNGFRAFLTLPLYHNHGLSTFFRAICTGTPVALFNAALPLTASNLVRAMAAVKPESFHGVPYALKMLSESSRGIELLANCKLVLFGGSSCPDELGDKLVGSGVYLVSHYGATEMGQLMTSFRPKNDLAWNYVRPFAAVEPFLHFAPRDNGLYECVVLDGWKSKVSSNSDDPPHSFHTSDLFQPHSTIPNAWKYVSRSDDRITLVNGEKVLPIPYENRLRQNKLIREALLFGVGKALPGLLLIPSSVPEIQGLGNDTFVETVWPAIQEANEKAESFGRITPEMVLVLDPDIDYPATDKGTMIRAASYKKFAKEIEDVYRRFEGEETTTSTGKRKLDQIGLQDFLTQRISQIVGTKLGEDDDFFNSGMDSLQAITIRAMISREINIGTADLSNNVVFDHATIRNLAAHLHFLRTGERAEHQTDEQVMQELIEKHSNFDKHVPRPFEVVLLTGTTGGLGAHVLSKLLDMDHVRAIYCPVRAADPAQALDRVVGTLCDRGRPPRSNIHKIIALPSDFSQPDLGFPQLVLADLKARLTKVIHSAWAVNFNLGVRSFEQQHIQGVHNLITLCLAVDGPKPADFYFCSSISAAAGTPLPAVIDEAAVPELAHAQKMGYAQSKLVAERITVAAAERTGMTARVLRIGQIVGDSEDGIWNNTEAIPLMIRSAQTIHALPALAETPSWLPVDVVARAVLELTGISHVNDSSPASPDPPSIIYHVQNPRLFRWTEDFLPALQQAGLDFEIVPQRKWVELLRQSDPDPVRNPTMKLLDFFAEKYDNDRPGRSGLSFKTERTEAASPCLRGGFDVIDSGLVGKMVEWFQKTW